MIVFVLFKYSTLGAVVFRHCKNGNNQVIWAFISDQVNFSVINTVIIYITFCVFRSCCPYFFFTKQNLHTIKKYQPRSFLKAWDFLQSQMLETFCIGLNFLCVNLAFNLFDMQWIFWVDIIFIIVLEKCVRILF